MIQVQDLRKTFGEVRAVDGVTFTARDGEITGLLGPNGAGKTTTLRMLYTLTRPDSGRVLVDGVDAALDPLGVRKLLGVLPDARGLYKKLTARENIDYFAQLQGLSADEVASRREALIEMLDMSDFADRPTEGFSQGQRLKTATARAMIHNPKNVLLDEPTNGLDIMATRRMRQFIRDLRTQGRCVLFSTHVMQEVAQLCDRIVIIAKGRVVADDSPDALRAQTGDANLEDAFVKIIGSGEGLAA